MLPRDLLTLRWLAGEASPRYLCPEDEPWVRVLIDECRALVGVTAKEREALFDQRLPLVASAHGASTRGAAAVLHVLARFFTVRPVASAPPARVRQVVFHEATAHPAPRHDVLQRAAETLGLEVDQVLEALFADRPDVRRVVAPEVDPSPSEVIALHNVALLQGFLLQAETVEISLPRPERSITRYARSRSLLCGCTIGTEATTLFLSGPLSSLRATGKYGRAFAGLVPLLGGSNDWWLRARCRVGERSLVVHARSADPLGTHWAPALGQSRVERWLERDFQAPVGAWSLQPHRQPLSLGSTVAFPDYLLVRDDGATVPVEVIGWCTPEYLVARLRTLETPRPALVLCVEQSVDRIPPIPSLPSIEASVLRYDKRVDQHALVAMAQRLVDEAHKPRALQLGAAS